MARTKGAKDLRPRKRKGETNGEAGIEQTVYTQVGAGHNGPPLELTEEERRALTYDWKRRYAQNEADVADLKVSLKSLKDASKELLQQASAMLGDGAADTIKDLVAAEGPVGEAALMAEVERKLNVLALLGRGAQLDLFRTPDRTPAEDRAYEHGWAAGASGETCRPPHDPSVPQHQRWLDGWHAGQAALASAFKKLEPADDEGDVRPPFLQRREAERAAADNVAAL